MTAVYELYEWAFLALLGGYLVSSWWAGVDSRYLVVMVVGLLVCSAVLGSLGDSAIANTLALYVIFLLAGGVLLLGFEHLGLIARRTPHPDVPSAADSVGHPR